jgi:hypothetical protein
MYIKTAATASKLSFEQSTSSTKSSIVKNGTGFYLSRSGACLTSSFKSFLLRASEHTKTFSFSLSAVSMFVLLIITSARNKNSLFEI